jgi:hypothetical protein
VGLKSLKSLNLTNVYPNNKKKKKKNNNNNKVKSKPLELRSRVKTDILNRLGSECYLKFFLVILFFSWIFLQKCALKSLEHGRIPGISFSHYSTQKTIVH